VTYDLIGRQAAIPVQIAHHKAAGKSNHGKIRDALTQREEQLLTLEDAVRKMPSFPAPKFGL
jgi:N-acyl-D-aspartate/D-glutamate deacylase